MGRRSLLCNSKMEISMLSLAGERECRERTGEELRKVFTSSWQTLAASNALHIPEPLACELLSLLGHIVTDKPIEILN